MKNSLLLVLLCVGLTGTVCGYDWDYFKFTQSWPPATCAEGILKNHTCAIPAALKDWTIHGLWPARADLHWPTHCNSSWHFDGNQLATIMADMKAHWTNLFSDTAPYGLWTHEWSKHGTCCTDLPATSNELNYFSQGLQMNKKFDIGSILADSGIVPTLAKTYSYNDFTEAVKKATGYVPVIDCTFMKMKNGSGMHLIYEVEICFDKTFTPINCYDAASAAPVDLNPAAGDMMDGSMRYMPWHQMGRHVHKTQTSCPTSYDFYYPPIDTHVHEMILK